MDLKSQEVFPFFAHRSDHFTNTSTVRIRSTQDAKGRWQETAQRPSDVITLVLALQPPYRRLDGFSVRESDPNSEVFDYATTVTGVPRADQLIFAGHQLQDDGSTVHEAGLTNGSMIHVVAQMRVRKPVIYLYPPTAIDVSVRLSVIPSWEYSAVYPLTAIKKLEPAKGQVGQQIEWHVHANPSGLLRDKLSGKDVAYLFWEAECAGYLALLFQTDGRFQNLCDLSSATLHTSFLPSQLSSPPLSPGQRSCIRPHGASSHPR